MAAAHRRPSRLYLYLPFAIAGVIVAAYGLLWLQGAKEMHKSVDSWVEDQRETGLAVSYRKISTGGFPFFLRATIDDVDIADADRWRWRTDHLAVDALPYALDRLIFSPLGEQRFEGRGLGAWRAQAEDVRASVANDSARGWLFSLEISNGAAQSETEASQASVSKFLINVAPDAEDPGFIEISLHTSDIAIEDGERSLSVTLLDMAVGLSQTAAMAESEDPATAWREAGGALYLRGFGMKAEGTTLMAEGVLGLDTEGYPAGAVGAVIENPAGVAKLLQGAGILTKQESEAVGAGLALMALATGGKLAAPVDFQDGQARIGKIKLADLPRIQ